jgi:hypothetical protein
MSGFVQRKFPRLYSGFSCSGVDGSELLFAFVVLTAVVGYVFFAIAFSPGDGSRGVGDSQILITFTVGATVSLALIVRWLIWQGQRSE